MCFQLLAILTDQGNISEGLVFSQVSKDNFNILMGPSQSLVTGHHSPKAQQKWYRLLSLFRIISVALKLKYADVNISGVGAVLI